VEWDFKGRKWGDRLRRLTANGGMDENWAGIDRPVLGAGKTDNEAFWGGNIFGRNIFIP